MQLLSRSVASRVGFILKVDEIEKTFVDIECVNTEPVRIVLRGGAEPYDLSVARRMPISLQPKVKEELHRLQAAGLLCPTSMVCTNGASSEEI